MKKEGKKTHLRLAMSEPPKKRKKSIGQEGSITKKKMESMTAQKKKSKVAALQQEKERQLDPVSKKLFKSKDVTGSTIKKTSKCKSHTLTPNPREETPEPANDRQVHSSDQSEKIPVDVISKKLFEHENVTGSRKKKTLKRKSHTLTPKSGKKTPGLESARKVNSLEQAEKTPVDPISKNLFESEKVIGSTEQKTTKHKSQALTGSKAEVASDLKSGREVVSPEHVMNTPADITKKGTKRGKRGKTPKMTSTPNSDEHTNGTELDSSLNSTLPMQEDTKSKGKRKRREGDEDNVVTFPGTPALQSLTKRQKGALDTPVVTEKTPMPTGSEQWLDSDDMTDDSAGRENSDTGKKEPEEKLSREGDKKIKASEKREGSKENAPYVLKCMNIPRGTKAAYLSLFLSEMDLNPQIRIKKLRRGGARSQTKAIRYAIFTCNTKEERDELLDLDEISLPSGSTGKEWTLRIVPQMTQRESRSNRALRILNTPEEVSEDDFIEFFAERKVRVKKAIIYRNDKVAIVFLRSPMDVKRALKCKERTMKGSQMQFVVNKGYVNFDKDGKILTETPREK